MAIRQPDSGNTRAHLFELEETGRSLQIKGELPMLDGRM